MKDITNTMTLPNPSEISSPLRPRVVDSLNKAKAAKPFSSSIEASCSKKLTFSEQKWLCYPSEQVVNCFHEIQAITTNVLKRDVPKKNVKKSKVRVPPEVKFLTL